MTENQHPHDPLDDVVAALRGMPVPPDRPPDAELLQRLRQASAAPPARPLSLIERIRTMNPIARAALMAATILAAVLLGVGLQPGSLALADVQEAIREHKVVRYTDTQDVADGKSMTQTVYLETNLERMRMELTDPGVVNVFDFKQRKLLGLFPEKKMAFRMDLVGTRSSAGSFAEVIDRVRDDKQAVRTEEELDGRRVVAYRRTFEEKFLDPGSNETFDRLAMTIWVDRETRLPVKIEQVRSNAEKKRYAVQSDFVWDPPGIDETTFSVEPPAGYDLQEIRPEPAPETSAE